MFSDFLISLIPPQSPEFSYRSHRDSFLLRSLFVTQSIILKKWSRARNISLLQCTALSIATVVLYDYVIHTSFFIVMVIGLILLIKAFLAYTPVSLIYTTLFEVR